jgi:hypothetical protein
VQLPSFKSVWKKAALVAVTLGGLICFGGASSEEARPVIVVRRPVVVVRHGFYGPRPFYYGYGYAQPVLVEHDWRDRFGCWHRY